MIHPLLTNIDSLDFRNSAIVKDFGSLFINSANLLGWGIGTPIPPSVRSEMLRIGKKWLLGVKINGANYSPAEHLRLHNTCDMIYRIVWKAAPDSSVALRVINEALDAHIHGDRENDIYILYRLISNGLEFQPKVYAGKPLDWKSIMLESWYEELKTGSYRNPKSIMKSCNGSSRISDCDIINRVSILMDTDLRVFTSDQGSFKKRLFDNHKFYIDDLLSGNADYEICTLTALGHFIKAAWPKFITQKEHYSYRMATLSAFAAKTTSPYLKASIEVMQKADKQPAER